MGVGEEGAGEEGVGEEAAGEEKMGKGLERRGHFTLSVSWRSAEGNEINI